MPSTILGAIKPPTFEGKPIVMNPDGSWSHERSMTVNIGGKVMNIPTMFGGKQVSPQTAVEILRKNNWVDPDNGKPIKTFKSEEEAMRAAKDKEKQLQAVKLTPEQIQALQMQADQAKKAQPQDQQPQNAKSAVKSVWDYIGGKVD